MVYHYPFYCHYQKPLEKAGLKMEDIEYAELNEAFSVVGIVNTQKLELDPKKVKCKWRRCLIRSSIRLQWRTNNCNT
ncbi:MAG: hypothetical protein WKF59_20910 [Chitinophagaceae bacterium]